MTELLTLIALWCGPASYGPANGETPYERVQDCRKRAWSCLEYGRKSYSPQQLEKCLLQGHPERE